MTLTEEIRGRHKKTAGYVLATTLTVGTLYLAVQAFSGWACWSVFFVAALVAWPIWRYQSENALFRRRAFLASVSVEGSRIRRWFWAGRISVVGQVFVALAWAILLLAFGALLSPMQWLVLVVDALVLGLIIGPVTRLLAGEIRAEQLNLVSRRWPLYWFNVAVLTLAFLAIDFLIGVPDTRGLAWNAVAETAFSRASATTTCQAVGWLVGSLAAAGGLAWHAYEVLIPSLPNTGLKLVAWGVFLVQAGVISLAFTHLQLGVVALVENRSLSWTALIGETRSSKAFFFTILVLALLYVYASFQMQRADLSGMGNSARKVVDWINPCRPDAPALKALQAEVNGEIDTWRRKAKQDTKNKIDDELNQIFTGLETGVDKYLDWYFSVIGEYQRLGAAVMRYELDRNLFAGPEFDERVKKASGEIASESEKQLAELAKKLGMKIRSDIQENPCRFDALNRSALKEVVERDWKRALGASSTGAAVGTLTATLLAKKTTVAVAGKLASKKIFQGAASLGAKAVAKKGGAILVAAAGATAVCSPTGPFAVLCGIAAGTVTWLTVDTALITIDEAMFRAQMHAEILETLREQRAALAKDLQNMHHAAINQNAAMVGESTGRIFIPLRDGL